MDITVNGAVETVAEDSTVAGILAIRGHTAGRVVVECNGEIIPAETFSGTRLHSGDRLEIVQFVGGG